MILNVRLKTDVCGFVKAVAIMFAAQTPVAQNKDHCQKTDADHRNLIIAVFSY